jgi:hypothetical protein
LEAFAEKTPNSKVKVLKETLASPSYTAPWLDMGTRESTVSFLTCRVLLYLWMHLRS